MKSLFLFFTQGEAGAPHYLSRTGEQGVETLTETIYSFLTESLQIDFISTQEIRTKSLNEDIKWRSFKDKDVFSDAVRAALELYPQLIIVSGSDMRTFKTSEPIAQKLALPVCVDERFDRFDKSKPEISTLNDALNDFTELLNEEVSPSLVLVGTSLTSLLEWVKSQTPKNYHENFEKILKISSENDTIPAVLVAGFEKISDKVSWIFDLPDEVTSV